MRINHYYRKGIVRNIGNTLLCAADGVVADGGLCASVLCLPTDT